MNRLKGKKALITGASSGIGQACAESFAGYGMDLILIARREERLKALAARLEKEYGVKAECFTLDVRDREGVIAFGVELDSRAVNIDVLLNNAGLASGLSKIYEGDFADWDAMIDTNVKGLLNISRAIIPMMVARNKGHIINIGSIAGHIVYPSGNVYNATKFAVKALNEAMTIDLLGTDIRVSSIDPGAVETEFSEVRFHGDKERAKNVYKGYKALSAKDIAEVVTFVANAPAHVNILDMIIMPTAQRNPYLLAKKEN